MEEERIVWTSILDQPVHCSQNVGFCRLAHGVLLVVGKENHVLPLVVEVGIQVCAHVLYVVDATSELSALAKVVDTNEQCFPASVASRVLERIATGGAVAKGLRSGRGWWGTAHALLLHLRCYVRQCELTKSRRGTYAAAGNVAAVVVVPHSRTAEVGVSVGASSASRFSKSEFKMVLLTHLLVATILLRGRALLVATVVGRLWRGRLLVSAVLLWRSARCLSAFRWRDFGCHHSRSTVARRRVALGRAVVLLWWRGAVVWSAIVVLLARVIRHGYGRGHGRSRSRDGCGCGGAVWLVMRRRVGRRSEREGKQPRSGSSAGEAPVVGARRTCVGRRGEGRERRLGCSRVDDERKVWRKILSCRGRVRLTGGGSGVEDFAVGG